MEFLICAKIDLRKKLREIENYHPTTIKGLGQIKYTNILEEAKINDSSCTVCGTHL